MKRLLQMVMATTMAIVGCSEAEPLKCPGGKIATEWGNNIKCGETIKSPYCSCRHHLRRDGGPASPDLTYTCPSCGKQYIVKPSLNR
jgi:hypothetical protein